MISNKRYKKIDGRDGAPIRSRNGISIDSQSSSRLDTQEPEEQKPTSIPYTKKDSAAAFAHHENATIATPQISEKPMPKLQAPVSDKQIQKEREEQLRQRMGEVQNMIRERDRQRQDDEIARWQAPEVTTIDIPKPQESIDLSADSHDALPFDDEDPLYPFIDNDEIKPNHNERRW